MEPLKFRAKVQMLVMTNESPTGVLGELVIGEGCVNNPHYYLRIPLPKTVRLDDEYEINIAPVEVEVVV